MMYFDREKESEKIYELYKNSNQSTILLMFSRTGTGKSSLSHKFMNSVNDNSVDKIYVVTNQINNNEANQGYYIMEVFKWFFKYYNDTHQYSFQNYLFKNKTYKKYIISRFLSETQSQTNLKSIILKVFGINLIKRFLKIDEFDYETLFYDYSKQTLKIVKEYIEFILKNRKILLIIDNIQNIDNLSLESILDWFSEHKENCHFLIFEYTVSEDRESIIKLRDRIQNYDISFCFFELGIMDPNNAVKAAKSKAQNTVNYSFTLQDRKAVEYYNTVDGNIRSLEDFIRNFNNDKANILKHSATYACIESLEKNEALVLSIICLNDSKINKYLLFNLLSQKSIIISKNSLNNLIYSYDLIIDFEDEYSIKHASIYDNWLELSTTKLKAISLIAYNILIEYYNRLFANNISKSHRAFFMLIKLYSRFAPEKLYGLLNKFDDILQEFLSPNQLEDYILTVDKEIESHSIRFTDFYYKLIDISLNAKLFDLAELLLDRTFTNSSINKNIFYKCNIFIQREDYTSNIQYIERILPTINNSYFVLYLKLFLMISYRSINDYNKVKSINREIQEVIDQYNNTLFTGFYLRLSELRNNRKNAIPDVEESIKHFQNHSLIEQVAKSQVALSFLYAVTGRTEDAITESNKAEKIIVKNFSNRHIFYTNKAAILLLHGDTGEEILTMLKIAEESAIVTFEKLSIYNNILVYAMETKDISIAELYVKKILSIISIEPDKHILSLLYFNLYEYYKRTNNEIYKEYYKKCYSLKNHCESLNARLTHTELIGSSQILISKPWHVCFLDFWNIDYCEDFS